MLFQTTNMIRTMVVKTYKIHDNGGRPFSVEVDGKKVTVIQHKGHYVEDEKGNLQWVPEPPKKLFTKMVDEIFIGKKSPGGGYDGLKPSQAEGNSILVRKGNKYTYIGSEIFEFDPIKGDEIVQYYSDIGNSDVPYPYAVGKTHVYIMLEKTAVEKSYFDSMKDIYGEYWFETYARDCHLGVFVKEPPFCKEVKANPEKTKKKLRNLKQKTRKLKQKILMKRDV